MNHSIMMSLLCKTACTHVTTHMLTEVHTFTIHHIHIITEQHVNDP